jgi:hypothetical protein
LTGDSSERNIAKLNFMPLDQIQQQIDWTSKLARINSERSLFFDHLDGCLLGLGIQQSFKAHSYFTRSDYIGCFSNIGQRKLPQKNTQIIVWGSLYLVDITHVDPG